MLKAENYHGAENYQQLEGTVQEGFSLKHIYILDHADL